jgi:hypothetical protein
MTSSPIADAGEQAGRRYVEFFTASIHYPQTRRAHARTCGPGFHLVEARLLAPDRWPSHTSEPSVTRLRRTSFVIFPI